MIEGNKRVTNCKKMQRNKKCGLQANKQNNQERNKETNVTTAIKKRQTKAFEFGAIIDNDGKEKRRRLMFLKVLRVKQKLCLDGNLIHG